MSATQRERPSRGDKLRDAVSFVFAWGIIFYQMLGVPPKDVNEAFLVLAGGLIGAPFGAEAWARIRGGGATTTPPEQSSPSSASAPSSP